MIKAYASSPYEVTTTKSGDYTYFLIKRKFTGTGINTDIHAGSNLVEDLYIGTTKIKQVWIGGDLYYDSTATSSYTVDGSKYKFTYCTFAKNGTKYYNTFGVNTSTGGGTLSEGFIFEPERLYKINNDGTISLGSTSNLTLELFHMGTPLYKAPVSKGYMYYLNDLLVAIYNTTSNTCSISTYFGGEVPSSLRQYYLDPYHFTFVCPYNISSCVDQNTSTSTGDGLSSVSSNKIDVHISSSLDSVVLKDGLYPSPVI